MKYIRMKRLDNVWDAFIIFPQRATHLGVARKLGLDSVGVISAGFVKIDESGNPVCYGKSVGLRVSSREDDTPALQKQWSEEPH